METYLAKYLIIVVKTFVGNFIKDMLQKLSFKKKLSFTVSLPFHNWACVLYLSGILVLDFQSVQESESKMKSFNQWNESFQNKEKKFIQVQKLLDQNKGNFRTRTNYLYRMLDCFSCCSHKMIGYIIKKGVYTAA